MSEIANGLGQMSFLTLVWIFYVFVVLHELEEWNIDQFEHRRFEGVPPAATDRSARMVILFVVLVGLVWCLAATIPGSPALAAWIFIPAVSILVLNAIQHMLWSLYFRQAAPGVISSVLLLIPSGSFLVARALQQGYIPTWYAAVWAAFVIAGLVLTLKAGNQMMPTIRTVNNIGVWLEERFTSRAL